MAFPIAACKSRLFITLFDVGTSVFLLQDKLNQWTFGGVCVVVALLVVEALVVMVLKHMSENNTEVSMQLKPYSTLNDHPGDLPTGVDQDGAVVTEKRKKGWGLQALSIPPALRAPFLATMCLVFLCATGLLQVCRLDSDSGGQKTLKFRLEDRRL